MNDTTKNRQIANSYYNLGLEKAKIRNLTGAADCFKRSLRFNKYHTDARNVLGLIYYEIGEAAHALVQWVVSMNLQPENNRADVYLEELQRSSNRLDMAGQDIKKFNVALSYAQNDNADLAILQLTRVVDSNSKYVKAHLLLALLYLQNKDYTRAGRSLYRILQIDKNNPKALHYMSVVKRNTGRAEVEKKKLKNAFSHRQMQDDDIIIPPSYKENTGFQTVMNIITGLVLGAAVVFFIAIPTKTKALGNAHNKEMIAYSQEMNKKSLEIDRLNKQLAAADQEKDEAVESLSTIVDDNGGVLMQYQTVINILEAYRRNDFQAVVLHYTTLDASMITLNEAAAVVAQIRADMEANGYQVLQSLGDTASASGDTAAALDYYQKSLNIKPDNLQVIFNMAMIYKNRDEKDTANQLFGTIIMEHPGTELAVRAKEERGY